MKPLNLKIAISWCGQFKPFYSNYIAPCRVIKCSHLNPTINRGVHGACTHCIVDVTTNMLGVHTQKIIDVLTKTMQIIEETHHVPDKHKDG